MYLVKGYIANGDSQKHVSVLVDASGCVDAAAVAVKHFDLSDITSIALSPIREVVQSPKPFGGYFTAVATQPTAAKTLRYQMLILAESFDDARQTAYDALAQGYDMELAALRKTELYGIAQ